jgi:type III restriction enzyme
MTVKPIQATTASHLNFVACDTKTWEQAAMARLEQLALEGVVLAYARNDHLEFNIPYEFFGLSRVYEPDFLVRLVNGLTLTLEVKGQPHQETEAKHQAAKRWTAAVNRWGGLGRWEFLVCWEPQRLGEEIARLAGDPAKASLS